MQHVSACIQVELFNNKYLIFVLTFVVVIGDAVVNTLCDVLKGNYMDKREVRQFQFTAWPDHGVPEHPLPLLQFIRRVKSMTPTDNVPTVVHCRSISNSLIISSSEQSAWTCWAEVWHIRPKILPESETRNGPGFDKNDQTIKSDEKVHNVIESLQTTCKR